MSDNDIPHVAVVTGAVAASAGPSHGGFAADGIRVLAVSRSMRAGDGRLQGSLEETVAQIRADGGTAQPLCSTSAIRTATAPR